MKLLLTIVQDADAGNLQQALTERGFGVTKLSSTGGFLRRGNTTLLIGIDDDDIEAVKELVAATCRRRWQLLTPGASLVDIEGVFSTMSDTVEVGGATIFVLGVERRIRI